MTLAVSQDRIAKILSESGLAQLSPDGENAGGDGFLTLMDELTGGGSKKDGEPQKAVEGEFPTITTSAMPLVALDATLASASIVGTLQASAQIVAATTLEADASASTAIKDLAQLLVKSANDAQGAAQTKMQSQPQTPIDDTSGADMSSVGQTLEAWSQGPSSVAAMTSGAQDKRPMQLSVVDVATHFAPVEMVADAPSKDQQVAADNKGVKLEAQAQPSIGIAVTDKQAQGGQAGGGAFDRGTQDKTPEPQIVPEARVDASSDIETLDIQPLTGQHASPARQVAQEVAREIPAMKHTAELYQDVKAPLSKLQVLKIQLQPENLGSVNVRIQLRADAIELHIDTSRAETAELLKRDRETLSTIMRAAGYAADDAQIKITHGDATMSAAMISAMDPSSSNSPTSQNSQNGGQSFAQSGTNERSAGSQDREGGQRQSGHDRADQHSGRERDGRPGPAAGQGSGIYL